MSEANDGQNSSPTAKSQKQPFFIFDHFKAILFRRWIMIKRSLRTIIVSSLGTVIFSALAIICYYLMVMLMVSSGEPYNFNSYIGKSPYIILVDEAKEEDGTHSAEFENIKKMLSATFKQDTGMDPIFLENNTREEANEFMYSIATNMEDEIEYINFGLVYSGIEENSQGNEAFQFTILYNDTQSDSFKATQVNLMRLMWKMIFGQDKDFSVVPIRLFLNIQELAFGMLGPMLITAGLCSIIPLFISQPIVDINGEVRPYMVSCTLTILPYWVATFLVDFIIWIIDVTIVWIIFLACQIGGFLDNVFGTWYGLVLSGPSFIFFIYMLSFAFTSADSAARQAFLIMVIILLVPMIVDIVRNFEVAPVWLDFIYSLFPHILIMRVLYIFLSNIGLSAHSIGYYFTEDEHGQVYLIMQYVDIVIFGFIVFIIEKVRIHFQRKSAQRSFGNYSQFFKEQKEKHPVTEEAHEMERQVHDPNNKWAVKIDNVSRLFFNTAGQPIPAVNCVSLGVKEGSLFGFLGANGAGKTTLIRMITSLLPPSDGHIEINGVDIEEFNDPTLLAICPQFNTHLCDEMTPREHFQLYSMLFRLPKDESEKKSDELIKLLELEEIQDKPIRDLSAGDVRKLAIALCFLGPAKIILLDEPTASLDPVARKHVHEMITTFKGQKTFMLCTHLLSEAETLCDEISIMIKGNVYTCGSPQYLAAKFGTEFKIDLQLVDDTPETSAKVDDFFESKLPEAELSILRPRARIYSIPASATTLPELFDIMQAGKEGENGFNYYTCSSSSLERVFMEIVHMSESEDLVVVKKDKENDPSKKDEEEKKEQEEATKESTNQSQPSQQVEVVDQNEDAFIAP